MLLVHEQWTQRTSIVNRGPLNYTETNFQPTWICNFPSKFYILILHVFKCMFYYARKRMGGLPTVIVVCCWSHIVWGHAVKKIGAAQGKAGPIHTQAPSHDWPAKHARMKTREDKATRPASNAWIQIISIKSFILSPSSRGRCRNSNMLCALIP